MKAKLSGPPALAAVTSFLVFSSHLCHHRCGVIRHIKNDDLEGNRNEYSVDQSACFNFY